MSRRTPTSASHPAQPRPAPLGPGRPVEECLGLEANLTLMAGAGTGKTHTLVTLCLHLLSGARASRRLVRPSELVLITFTAAAAAELRSRLRDRLTSLARGEQGEPELSASFARLSCPVPPASFWRQVRDQLGSATIGTFHAMCAQLLRRAPGGLGVDPAFVLLDETDARSLLVDVAERLVLDEAAAGGPLVRELLRELGFSSGTRHRALVDHLCAALAQLREEGIAPADVSLQSADAARGAFDDRVQELLDGCRARLSDADCAKYHSALGEVQAALDGMTLESFGSPERGARVDRGRDGFGRARVASLAQYRRELDGEGGKPSLEALYGAWVAVPYEHALVELLTRLRQRHRQALQERRALDYTELLLRTRDALRDLPHFRAEVQSGIGALLVDEFQDTNRLQSELVQLLCERREGAPRSFTLPLGAELGAEQRSDILELPLEPGILCVVGDRKQSIYEFRGADVSVFGALAERLDGQGGQRAYLQQNRRSTPSLLTAFNGLFRHVLAPPDDPAEFDTLYVPEHDDLLPHESRADVPRQPAVERLLRPGEAKLRAEAAATREAQDLAGYVEWLLSDAAAVEVSGDAGLRRVRGGDIAVLFRRFTYIERFRQAFFGRGIPHRVIRGRGFYAAQEVLDLASFLCAVVDPGDQLALAATLRAPWVGLADESWVRLARAGGPAGLSALTPATDLPPELPGDERRRLIRYLALVERLRVERDRLGVRDLLAVALEETAFRVSLAGAPYGEQALVNIEKLLDLAGRWDRAGRGGPAGFARRLRELAESVPTEAQAEVLDSSDPRAVQLLTIHQAKGLQWPVVVVAELSAQLRAPTARLAVERQLGLALRPWSRPGVSVPSARHSEVQDRLARREEAGFRRLLYVALTRARDRLVLCGDQPRRKGTWWALVDQALAAEPSVASLVRDVDPDALAAPRAAEEARPIAPREPADGPGEGAAPAVQQSAPSQQVSTTADRADEGAAVDAALARVRGRARVAPRSAVLAVTPLQDFSRCPRRFHLAHQVGLSEHPFALDLEDDAGEGGGTLDARERGTLAHGVLERLPLAALGSDATTAVHELLAAQGVDPGSAAGAEISAWVTRFLSTPFAARLAQLGDGRVHRELPFLLSLEHRGFTLHLKGQIDLLVAEEDGTAQVIDYKSSVRPASGLSPYRFQLDCYALAARRLLSPGAQVFTGISFLREVDPSPVLEAAPAAEGLEQRLVDLARTLASREPFEEWPGLAENSCRALCCGYRYRCYPAI